MKKLLLLTAAALAILTGLPACAESRPVPPHWSGDGGRGLNPGSRAESANGSDVNRAIDQH